MDIHKPKRWHGVREFLKEYLIIVVGVLTALAGEQAVELAHRQTELSETREALRQEIAHNAMVAAYGAAQDRCREGRATLILNWAHGGPRPRNIAGGQYNMTFSAWDVAKAGPLAKMPVKERLSYSRVYDAFAAQQVNISNQISQNLETSEYTGLDKLAPNQAQRLIELMNRNLTTREVKLRTAASILQAVEGLGIRPERPTEQDRQALIELCGSAGLPAPAL